MTPDEIIELIDDIAASLHPRTSGNEESAIIAKRIQSLAVTERENLIKAFQKFLSFRVAPSKRTHEDVREEAGIWMALSIADQLSLTELIPDVEALLKDVREGKVLMPDNESTIGRYLETLKLLEMTNREELIKALRKHLSYRRKSTERAWDDGEDEADVWMALDIAKRRALYELKPDVESLLKDARESKVFNKAHIPSVEKYLGIFSKMTPQTKQTPHG